jgi:hypothetical protein
MTWWEELLTASSGVSGSIPGSAVGIFPCSGRSHSPLVGVSCTTYVSVPSRHPTLTHPHITQSPPDAPHSHPHITQSPPDTPHSHILTSLSSLPTLHTHTSSHHSHHQHNLTAPCGRPNLRSRLQFGHSHDGGQGGA